MERIQIKGRKFGYRVGVTFMGVKEYRSLENSADRLVSFACPIPETLGELDTAERVKAIRQVILLRVFGVNEEAEHAEKF